MFVQLISFLYHALFLTSPLLFFWGHSELFELNKMLFIYVMATLVGSLWLIRSVTEKKLYWRQHPLVTLNLIFLAGQMLSTVFSIHLPTSIWGYYSRLNGGLISSLAFSVLALGLWNNVPRKKLLTFFISHGLGLVLTILYALPEHFGVSPSCLIMKQEFNTACWKQDVQARIFGTFGQPNWLASYIIGALPIIFFLRDQYKKHLPIIWEIILVLATVTVWFTKSKSGLGGLILVLKTLFLLFIYKKSPQLQKTLQHRLVLPLLTILVILGSIGGSFLLHQRTINDLNSLDLSQGTDSFSIRSIVWDGAVKVWQRYPIFGSGPATFAYSFYLDRPTEHNLVSEWDFLYNKAHNEFLNYLAETGIIGFVTYLVFLIGTMVYLWQNGKKYKSWANSSWVVLASLIGLSAVHFFGFSIAVTNLLIFTLPIITLDNSQLNQASDKNKTKTKSVTAKTALPNKQPLQWWQYLLIMLVVGMGLKILSSIGNFWLADRYYKQSKEKQEKSLYYEAAKLLEKAIALSPKEAIFYDEFADVYSILAFQYDTLNNSAMTDQLTKAAIDNSNYALSLNPRHLNFYKTRARVFLILAQLDAKYYLDAEHTLKAAIALSPNDAKLYYNLGLVQKEMQKLVEAQQSLEKAVFLKPNYLKARDELAMLYAETQQPTASLDQFSFILRHLAVDDPSFWQKYHQVEATAGATNQ
jgi:O-antigen ligase